MNPMLAPLLLSFTFAAPPAYRLEIEPAKEIEALLTQEFHAPEFHPTEWVFAAPRPPELPNQRDIKAEMIVVGHKIEHSIPHHALIIARVPVKEAHPMKVEVRYQALLRTVKLIPLAAGAKHPEIPPLNEEERREWTKPTEDFAYEAKGFQEWLTHHKLRREAKEGEIEFARRLFVFIATHFKYHLAEKMDRKPAAVCHAGKSDCGGISTLYVSALRANGIPARTLPGRMAESAKKGAKIDGVAFYQTHVKTDFHALGVGWVPVDPTGGMSQGEKVDDFYFGQDRADFLAFSLPAEHQFEIMGLGKQKVSGMQGVAYWALGKGKLNVKDSEDWKVEARLLKPEKK
ncbi:MAG: transglutaminase domain-containing protein [Planctomycetia bacterium]|nr:transglutaminase domain-containing protein [Planctomycetia bacterium]